MGPRRPRSTKLSEVEQAAVVEMRRRTLMPLDDVLGYLRQTIPQLSRGALRRCLVRHGISRLPRSDEKDSRRGRFPDTTPGYVHIDSCELRLAQNKVHMFLAIDRVTKFVFVAFFEAATKLNGAQFLRDIVAAFLYAIHTVVTDKGTPFAEQPRYRGGMTDRMGGHIVERVCWEHDIDHRLTKLYHPWTNGQAGRMNRTLKDATIKAFHYSDLGSAKGVCPGVRDGLQLRQAPQGIAMADPLPGRLPCMDQRALKVRSWPSPSHSGSKQLGAYKSTSSTAKSPARI